MPKIRGNSLCETFLEMGIRKNKETLLRQLAPTEFLELYLRANQLGIKLELQ